MLVVEDAMFVARLRRRGNSFVVTVPRAEVERLGLKEGQTVSFDIRLASARSLFEPTLKNAFETEFSRGHAALKYLAEH
jgi:antitoxin component of MazEF toxin-antitoxin module